MSRGQVTAITEVAPAVTEQAPEPKLCAILSTLAACCSTSCVSVLDAERRCTCLVVKQAGQCNGRDTSNRSRFPDTI